MNRSQLYWLALPLTIVVAVLCFVPHNRDRTKWALTPEGGASLDPPPPTAARSEAVALRRKSLAPPRAHASEPRTPAVAESTPQAIPEQPANDEHNPPAHATLQLELISSVDGAPIPGGVIELGIARRIVEGTYAPERILRRQADDRGALTVALEPCSLRIVAWSEHASSTRALAELRPGETLQVKLELTPARAFGGIVIDAVQGDPIPDAEVRVWTHNETDLVRTGPDGTFEHPRFPCVGKAQQVQVRAPGYGATIRYLKIEDNGRWSALAALEGQPTVRGEENPWIEIALVPERRLLGRVLGTDGRPITGARISAEGFFRVLPAVASRDVAAGITDESGRFELRGLRSDISHTLTISADTYADRSQPLTDVASQEHDVGDIHLHWEAALSGLVYDASGLVVEDALVRIVPLVDEVEASAEKKATLDVPFPFPQGERITRTDTAGVFTFAGLPTRGYRVSVERDDGPLITVAIAPEALSQEALTLRIPSTCLVLEGEVRDGDQPVVDAFVKVRRHGHVASTRTDAAGRFQVSGLDDRASYEVYAEWSGAHGSRKHALKRLFAFEKALLKPQRNTESKLARADVR